MNGTINVLIEKTVANLRGIEERSEKRLKLSLPMMLFDSEMKTKNISPHGVYFEVTTKDVESYSIGEEIVVQIEGIGPKSMIPGKAVLIYGLGLIVRADEIYATNHYKILGVGMKFSKGLKVYA